MTRLILKSGLCLWCPYRQWADPDDSDEITEFHEAGWHWCPTREDFVHNSMGCYKRKDDYKPECLSLRVRLGLEPNLQGEYLWGK